MTERTPAEKMRAKPGMRVAVLHEAEGIGPAALGLPDDVTLTDHPRGADFVLEFATSQAQAEERLRALKPHVGERTLAWLAYPKGSKAAGYDLNRDTIWAFAKTVGLESVANVSIDETWSGMRMRPAR